MESLLDLEVGIDTWEEIDSRELKDATAAAAALGELPGDGEERRNDEWGARGSGGDEDHEGVWRTITIGGRPVFGPDDLISESELIERRLTRRKAAQRPATASSPAGPRRRSGSARPSSARVVARAQRAQSRSTLRPSTMDSNPGRYYPSILEELDERERRRQRLCGDVSVVTPRRGQTKSRSKSNNKRTAAKNKRKSGRKRSGEVVRVWGGAGSRRRQQQVAPGLVASTFGSGEQHPIPGVTDRHSEAGPSLANATGSPVVVRSVYSMPATVAGHSFHPLASSQSSWVGPGSYRPNPYATRPRPKTAPAMREPQQHDKRRVPEADMIIQRIVGSDTVRALRLQPAARSLDAGKVPSNFEEEVLESKLKQAMQEPGRQGAGGGPGPGEYQRLSRVPKTYARKPSYKHQSRKHLIPGSDVPTPGPNSYDVIKSYKYVQPRPQSASFASGAYDGGSSGSSVREDAVAKRFRAPRRSKSTGDVVTVAQHLAESKPEERRRVLEERSKQREAHALLVRKRKKEALERKARLAEEALFRTTDEYRRKRAQELKDKAERETRERAWLESIVHAKALQQTWLPALQRAREERRQHDAAVVIVRAMKLYVARVRAKRMVIAQRLTKSFLFRRNLQRFIEARKAIKQRHVAVLVGFFDRIRCENVRLHVAATIRFRYAQVVAIQRQYRLSKARNKWRVWTMMLQFVAWSSSKKQRQRSRRGSSRQQQRQQLQLLQLDGGGDMSNALLHVANSPSGRSTPSALSAGGSRRSSMVSVSSVGSRSSRSNRGGGGGVKKKKKRSKTKVKKDAQDTQMQSRGGMQIALSLVTDSSAAADNGEASFHLHEPLSAMTMSSIASPSGRLSVDDHSFQSTASDFGSMLSSPASSAVGSASRRSSTVSSVFTFADFDDADDMSRRGSVVSSVSSASRRSSGIVSASSRRGKNKRRSMLGAATPKLVRATSGGGSVAYGVMYAEVSQILRHRILQYVQLKRNYQLAVGTQPEASKSAGHTPNRPELDAYSMRALSAGDDTPRSPLLSPGIPFPAPGDLSPTPSPSPSPSLRPRATPSRSLHHRSLSGMSRRNSLITLYGTTRLHVGLDQDDDDDDGASISGPGSTSEFHSARKGAHSAPPSRRTALVLPPEPTLRLLLSEEELRDLQVRISAHRRKSKRASLRVV